MTITPRRLVTRVKRAVRTAGGLSGLLAAVWLAGCATTRPLAAASDVHALLIAVRDNDHAGFEAHVDREALRARFQARLVEGARGANAGAGLTALGVLLSGPLSRAADGLLVSPEMFRAVADYYGYQPGRPIPSPLIVATLLKNGPGGSVCAAERRGGPCLMTFADEGGVWRLVDIDPAAARAVRAAAR